MKFILDLFRAPEGTPIRFQRYFVATNSIYVLAGGIHFVFIFFFGFVGAPEMMFFNMGSVLWFAFAIWINRKKFLVTSLYLCFIEVYTHAAVATYFFGWGAGYQYYALLFSTGIFLLPPGRTIQKSISILIGVFVFAGIYYHSVFNDPVYVWVSPYIDIINISNMIFSSLFHAGFAYYFTWSANQAENSLEKEHNAQTAFFQNISHELRTPLTLISGPSEIAYRKNANLTTDELRMVVNNSRRLTRLVNQLLDLQKITSGKVQIHKQSFNLVKMLKNIVDSFSSYANKKNVQIESHYSVEEIYVYADPEQIDKCLYNYLSNAFKFTPENGKIEIFLREQPERDSVMLEVKDNGIGMNSEQMKRLFSRFGISQASLTREQEGSGLGLSIVKEIIEMHGGEVGCKSTEGVGSNFYFTLPKSQENASDNSLVYKSPYFQDMIEEDLSYNPKSNSLSQSSDSKPDNQHSHILVVEDNSDLRSYIGSILTREGFMISVASNGKEGIEKAYNLKPDIILTDLMMPIKSGLDLIAEIRISQELKFTPIILLTAKADEFTRREVISEGANAYLPKPFEDRELIHTISNTLQLKEKEKALQKESDKLSILQKKMLQPPPRDWEGIVLDAFFKPSGQFSGDYYNFRRVDINRFQILLFDISGHGITTSLVLGMLHLCVEHLENDLPHEILKEINEKIYSHTSGYFLTGIVVEIDTKTKKISYSRAGHTKPILIRNGICNELKSSGKAIGILPRIQLDTETINYQTGDIVLLYTDGLSEARNPNREMWDGSGEFIQSIQRAAKKKDSFIENLLHEAEAFQAGTIFEDDVTILSIHLS